MMVSNRQSVDMVKECTDSMRVVKEAEERKMKYWMWQKDYSGQKVLTVPAPVIF